MNPQPVNVEITRLRRKIKKRDARIAGLQRHISILESALATKDLEANRLPRDIVRAVQEALCNVRMIPVLGVGSKAKIVEIQSRDA